jgi:ketosteroid isomerase-like protein
MSLTGPPRPRHTLEGIVRDAGMSHDRGMSITPRTLRIPRTGSDTAHVIELFNRAFQQRQPELIDDLVGADCVMESVEPAPNGTRYEGYETCVAFWRALAADQNSQFEPEEVVVSGDRATIRWRFRFGETDAESVRGVNLMHVVDGKIVEALGYVKSGATDIAGALDGAMS